MTTLAAIDIGTNTTLLSIASVREATARDSPAAPQIQVLVERAEITRLGRGIGSNGDLGAAGIDATLAALRTYAQLAQAHGARITAIGTEGLRRAPNARLFLDAARAVLGVEVEVIDGAREAELTFRAVVASFPALTGGGAPLVVVDIGGGSTEIVIAAGGAVRLRTSLPLGSVRLTERHIHHDPPQADEITAARAAIAAALDGVGAMAPRMLRDARLVGVAGTVTSLAAMAQNLESYDATRVHGFSLTSDALDAQIARLIPSTQIQREAMAGLDPRRADVILAGALILRAIVDRAGVDAAIVSDRGIRWGLLYEQAARETTPEV